MEVGGGARNLDWGRHPSRVAADATAQKLTGTTAGAPRLPCLQDRRWPPTPTVVLLLVLHQERGV